MKQRMRPIAWGLASAASALIYAAFEKRALTGDAGTWLMGLLYFGWPAFDTRLWRCFDALLQLPAWLVAALAGPRDWTQAIIVAWGLSFYLFPFVSLALCWVICRREKNERAFVFPAASFATATLATLAAATTAVPSALSIFWPLFLWVRAKKRGPYWLAGVIAGSAALALTHDSAFLLFAVLAIAVGAVNRVSLAFAACSAWLLVRGISAGHEMNGAFVDALRPAWGPFSWGMLIAIAGLIAACEAGMRFKGMEKRVLAGTAALAAAVPLALFFFQPGHAPEILSAFVSRAIAPPMAGILALASLRYAGNGKISWSSLSWLVAWLLLLGAAHDVALTASWRRSVHSLEARMSAKGEICSVLGYQTFLSELAPAGYQPASFPLASILLQGRRPGHVVFIEPKTGRQFFCLELRRGAISSSGHWPLAGPGYFDFSAIYPAGH